LNLSQLYSFFKIKLSCFSIFRTNNYKNRN